MSLTIPLSVRLVTAGVDRYVTRQVRDLAFRSVAVGGFASASIALDRPLIVEPAEIGYYGRLYVYDARNGKTVWEGRLEDPGRSATGSGTIWDISAVGPSAHASDRTVPLIYVDRNVTRTQRVDNVTPGATASVGDDPGASGAQSLNLQFPQGITVAVNSRVAMMYTDIWRAGMKLARYDYQWDAGFTTTGRQAEAVTRTDASLATGEASRSENLNVAGGGSSPKVVVTNFPNGRNTVELRQIVSGAPTGTIGADDSWVSFRDFVALTMRYNADGTEKTSGYATNTVLASDVVADLLGRLLTQFDGAGAKIATTSFAIEQLAYPDGISPAQVLNDLLVLEPGFRWGAWESNAAGKYRFEFSAWPTLVRYEADVQDGYTSTGSADGLYNAVAVRYRNVNGQIVTARRTSTVPDLAAAGITREAQIDLGDEIGTAAGADQAGDQFLAEHAVPPNAGRLTIARPIKDLVTGRYVMPWEIVPGNLIRVAGVQPRLDPLNATSRDGVTVFKIASQEYAASRAAAELELDSYSPSTARALADLRQRYEARRR